MNAKRCPCLLFNQIMSRISIVDGGQFDHSRFSAYVFNKKQLNRETTMAVTAVASYVDGRDCLYFCKKYVKLPRNPPVITPKPPEVGANATRTHSMLTSSRTAVQPNGHHKTIVRTYILYIVQIVCA